MIAERPQGQADHIPNLSDGWLYEPGGTARGGTDRLKQHNTAPGWGGPGTRRRVQSVGSEEGSRGGPVLNTLRPAKACLKPTT